MSITRFHYLLSQALKSETHKKFLNRIHDNLDNALNKKMDDLEDEGRISLTINSFGKMRAKDE